MIFRLFFTLLLFSANTFATPNIVVSIKPLHSIVSLLTQNVVTPELLLKNNTSAHHFHLQASQLSKLHSADLIVLVHSNFEAGFKKALSNIKADKKIMLSKERDNYHLWLDVDKMIEFSHQIAEKLIQIDAPNQLIYHANLDQVVSKLKRLKANIKQQLAPHHNQQVASFSNAFAYFIKANGLKNSTIVTQYHGERLSLFKILNAKNALKKTQAKCLLSTIDTPKKRINTLTENLAINTASIDIIGNGDYFKLMNTLSNQVNQCLK